MKTPENLCFFFMFSGYEMETLAKNGLYCKSSHRRCSVKKLFLKILQYSQETSCVGVNKDACLQLYQKETPTQAFICEFREIFKNTCFEKHLRMAAFVYLYCFIYHHLVKSIQSYYFMFSFRYYMTTCIIYVDNKI